MARHTCKTHRVIVVGAELKSYMVLTYGVLYNKRGTIMWDTNDAVIKYDTFKDSKGWKILKKPDISNRVCAKDNDGVELDIMDCDKGHGNNQVFIKIFNEGGNNGTTICCKCAMDAQKLMTIDLNQAILHLRAINIQRVDVPSEDREAWDKINNY